MSLLFPNTLHISFSYIYILVETTLVHIQVDLNNYRDITTFTLFCHGKTCMYRVHFIKSRNIIKKRFHLLVAVIHLYLQVGVINKWHYYKLLNGIHSWILPHQKMLPRNKRASLNKRETRYFLNNVGKSKYKLNIASVFLCFLYWNCN